MSHCKKIIIAILSLNCCMLTAADNASSLDAMRAALFNHAFDYGTLVDGTIYSSAEQEGRARLDEINRILDEVETETRGVERSLQQRGDQVAAIENKTFDLGRESEVFKIRAQQLAQKIREEATFLGFLRWACCCCRAQDNQ